MSTLPPAEFVGPGSWTATDVAGYMRIGVPPRVLRDVIARWPHPGDYEDAWRANADQMRDAKFPEPAAPVAAPAGAWMALAGTPEYPAALLETYSPPLMLFGRGSLEALRPGLGVVGTRKMTAYGEAVAETAVDVAVELKVPVHSGLAMGVDYTAHARAVAAGAPTVAVLATGADIVYPEQHAALLEEILQRGGAVISEHPFGTGTDTAPHYTPAQLAPRLLARNRIIAGLSCTLVVGEAAGRSGTMSTVWAALGMGRPVLVAMPRPHARNLPGAQAPMGLADPRPRTEDQLRAMGAPAAVAAQLAGRAPLASGVAESREDLALLTRVSLLMSEHYRKPPVETVDQSPNT